jgi:hypothetical protein
MLSLTTKILLVESHISNLEEMKYLSRGICGLIIQFDGWTMSSSPRQPTLQSMLQRNLRMLIPNLIWVVAWMAKAGGFVVNIFVRWARDRCLQE